MMGNGLLPPLSGGKITASYMNYAYLNRFGFNHYGMDMVATDGDWRVRASENGQVLFAGVDEVLGGALVLRYGNLIARYFHLESTVCTAGDWVEQGEIIALAGNTGKHTTGRHLHVEFDTDTKYWNWTPTLGTSTKSFIGSRQGANSLTMLDPAEVLDFDNGVGLEVRCKLMAGNSVYVNAKDKGKGGTA